MQGIILQIRYFERGFIKSFKKLNFIFLSNTMSSVCHSYVIRMSLVCTRMSSVCHSYVLVCHPYVTRMYSYVIRMSLVCTRMSSVCHSYVLVCHPYVTRMSSVCHSYVLVCNPYVTRMYSYVICLSLLCTRMSFVYHSYLVLPWTFFFLITICRTIKIISNTWNFLYYTICIIKNGKFNFLYDKYRKNFD